MFTVCPKCALTLVVTAADLRVAQGYVRCGRCSSVFNALARLSEERQPQPAAEVAGGPAAASTPAPPAPPAPSPAPPEPVPPQAEPSPSAQAALPEEALEFDPATTDLNSVFVQAPPDPAWTAATGSFKALIAANQEATPDELLPDSQVDVEIDAAFLASMLRSESGPAQPPSDPAPTAAAAPAAPPADKGPPRAEERAGLPARTAPAARPPPRPAAPHARPATGAATTPAPATRTPAPRFDRAADEAAGAEVREAHFAREEETPEAEATGAALGAGPRGAWLRAHAWPIGCVLAAVVLLAQVVNHDRDDLAVSARFNRPLTAVYGALGVKLFPRWDLRAYDVRQLGASAAGEGAGMITVRATIKNEAAQPQPMPLLRVTLQDRFGNRIAARDVQPKSYLPGAVPPASFLSAGQRIDAEMGFADPGTDAVGFEIDACLPARGGGVACANDAALR